VASVKLEYAWTKSEILRFFRGSRIFRIEMLCAGLVLLGGLVARGAWLFAAVGYAVVMVGSFAWLLPSKLWKTVEERGPLTVIVDDGGVSTATATRSSTVMWVEFPRSSETNEYFMLYRRKNPTMPMRIPKRGLSSPEDESTLREILAAHTAQFVKD
jgi:hypothetical protein